MICKNTDSVFINNYPGMLKKSVILFVSKFSFRDNSEIYILNNKKFKWRYYYYGQENRVGLPQYSASIPLYSDKVD